MSGEWRLDAYHHLKSMQTTLETFVTLAHRQYDVTSVDSCGESRLIKLALADAIICLFWACKRVLPTAAKSKPKAAPFGKKPPEKKA